MADAPPHGGKARREDGEAEERPGGDGPLKIGW
jgi:hypothetical protein